MKIKRIKLFSTPGQPQQPNQQPTKSGTNYQIESMKLQRQAMINNRLRQKLDSQQKLAESKRIVQIQRMEQKKEEQERRDRFNSSKLTAGNRQSERDNTHLYKSRPVMTPPVPMKN